MKVRRYRPEDAAAIADLNARLQSGGAAWPVYGEGPADTAQPDLISSRLFVAADDGAVRGAVWLREHEFWVNGEPLRAGWAKYPVSESLVDPAFGGVPGAMMFRVIREQPRLMALGMGGPAGPFARLLRGMGWQGGTVPFFFRLVRPARVLRRLRPIRGSALRRVALDLLSGSGLAWLGWQAMLAARRLTAPASAREYQAIAHDRFDGWADEVWARARARYRLIARRDAAMLNAVYADLPVVRLLVRRGREDVGWACVLHRDFTRAPDSPLGPLRVGLIADALAEPEDAHGVIAAATRYLLEGTVDLLISNQSHQAWGEALRSVGFLQGPSQFAFYRSPQMEAALPPQPASEGGIFVNRGDCDGPVFG